MSQPTDTMHLSLPGVAAVLRRRRGQILIAFALTLAAAGAATLLMPKKYETRMKVMVKNERAAMIVSPDRNGTPGYRGDVSESQINSEIELLTSNNLLRQVVTRCGLDRTEHAADASTATEKAVRRLQSAVRISPVRKSNIILVEYADTDPHRAVMVLSSLAELYLDEHLKIHGTPGTYEFFHAEAESYQRKLEDAEARLAEFRPQGDVAMLMEQKDAILQKAVDSESAAMRAEAAVAESAQKIAGTRRALNAANPRVVTQTRTSSNQYSVERLHTMLAELQNRRTQLLAKFRPDDRMVQETDQEIANTRTALNDATRLTGSDEASDVNPVHQALEIDLARQQAEFAGLEARRGALDRETAVYRRQMAKIANATATFDDLVRAKREAEDNYLLYAKKTEEARIAESLDREKIANVAIAETPVEPHLPSKPNVQLNLALGGLLGCFLSLGAAFAAEYLHGAAGQPAETEDAAGLPVLAPSQGD